LRAGGAPSTLHRDSMDARSPSSPRPARRLWSVAAALTAIAAAGCGHPATREECVVIFDKSAELELRDQNVTDPTLVAERVEAVRTARGEELIGKCVGKRVTDRAVACVRRAESNEQVDRCLQ
jgi:hypothetical protein